MDQLHLEPREIDLIREAVSRVVERAKRGLESSNGRTRRQAMTDLEIAEAVLAKLK